MRRLALGFAVLVGAAAALTVPACSVNLNPLAGLDAASLVPSGCPATIDELQKQNSITPECRAAIEGLLPQPRDNVKGRLFALGSETTAAGRTVIVSGVDPTGTPLDSGSADGGPSDLSVSVTAAGTVTDLTPDDYVVTDISTRTDTPFSVSLVSDYSASMSETDVRDASSIYTTFLDVMPPVYEGEVTIFSDTVLKKVGFTTNASDLRAAVAFDSTFTREATALYDGIGTAGTSLAARPTAAKLMLVATDGRENSSKQYTKTRIKGILGGGKVFVVMMGSLFADVGELQELAGTRGVFVYAHTVKAGADTVTVFVRSLAKALSVQIKPPNDTADIITVKRGVLQAEFPR